MQVSTLNPYMGVIQQYRPCRPIVDLGCVDFPEVVTYLADLVYLFSIEGIHNIYVYKKVLIGVFLQGLHLLEVGGVHQGVHLEG